MKHILALLLLTLSLFASIPQSTYDAVGNKLSQTDALNHTTSWSYTPTGELSSETLPQGERGIGVR